MNEKIKLLTKIKNTLTSDNLKLSNYHYTILALSPFKKKIIRVKEI